MSKEIRMIQPTDKILGRDFKEKIDPGTGTHYEEHITYLRDNNGNNHTHTEVRVPMRKEDWLIGIGGIFLITILPFIFNYVGRLF
jgi:hypothetical protein